MLKLPMIATDWAILEEYMSRLSTQHDALLVVKLPVSIIDKVKTEALEQLGIEVADESKIGDILDDDSYLFIDYTDEESAIKAAEKVANIDIWCCLWSRGRSIKEFGGV